MLLDYIICIDINNYFTLIISEFIIDSIYGTFDLYLVSTYDYESECIYNDEETDMLKSFASPDNVVDIEYYIFLY